MTALTHTSAVPAGMPTRLAAAHAAEADRRGRLEPDVVETITSAGFARHFSAGGTFTALFEWVAEVAQGCTSAAWCASLWATHARFARYLPESAQDEIWSTGPDVRIGAALTAFQASSTPVGSNGRALQGRWQYVSGADFSDWFLLSCLDPVDSSVRVHLVPRSACTIEETWDTTGMRGTGSHTVTVASATVPGHRTVPLARIIQGAERRDAPRTLRAPAQLAGSLLFAAPALGAARQALRLCAEEIHPGPSLPGARPAEPFGPRAARAAAESTAEIDAAETLLCAAIRRADSDPIDPMLVARNHRDAVAALRMLLSAVDRLVAASGMKAQQTHNGLNRRWRDLHTLSMHGALDWEQAVLNYTALADGVPT